MPNITQQQAINRWDRLPMILREAIFSERNADILWSVCETQHLGEDKISPIAALTGEVIMGFIHPEDLAKEIKEATGIHSDVADIIVKEVDRKIFGLIKSEIDKAYTLPVESEAPEEETETAAPEVGEEIVTDIRKAEVKITRYGKPAAETTFGTAEPMKIISTEEGEKVVLPGAESAEQRGTNAELRGIEEKKTEEMQQISQDSALSQRESALEEGPIVLHREKEMETALGAEKFGAQKSIGDLFGFLNGKKETPKKEAAEIQYGDTTEIPLKYSGDIMETPLKLDGDKVEIPLKYSGDTMEIPLKLDGDKMEMPLEKERVVHYDAGVTTPLENLQPTTNNQQPVVEEEKPEEKKESKPKLFFKNIIQTFKPMVKVVDFTEQPTTEVKEELQPEEIKPIEEKVEEINEMNKSNMEDMSDKSDMSNKTNITDDKEVEAPKVIIEEEKPAEEKPIEKKIGFFGKIFGKFKKSKDLNMSELDKSNEKDMSNMSNESNKTDMINMTNTTNETNLPNKTN